MTNQHTPQYTPSSGAAPGGFVFEQAAAEMEQAAHAFRPDGALAVLAALEHLPDGLAHIANVFAILAAHCDQAFPVDARVGAALADVHAILTSATDAAAEVGTVFRTAHSADLARLESPRTGEAMWDTTTTAASAPRAATPTPAPLTPVRGQRGIRVYTQQWDAELYQDAVANGDLPDATDSTGELYLISEWNEDYSEWNEDQSAWVAASDVQTAVLLLTGHTTNFYTQECSATGPQVEPRDWYTSRYVHPYTGEVTEQSAHLEGPWSTEEARAIHAELFAR